MFSKISNYIQLNEEGRFMLNGVLVSDKEYGQQLFDSLYLDDRQRPRVSFRGIEAFVEAIDEPFVVNNVLIIDGLWTLQMPYYYKVPFKLETLSLDEWDRFHGVSDKGIPFVLTNKAQAAFFDLLESFDDHSITYEGKRYDLPQWPGCNADAAKEEFWTDKYKQPEPPGWELDEPSQPLVEVLPQLKISKCRVLVIGCGMGHDAAHLAQLGHIVTAMDISEEAIRLAKEKYGEINNLTFVQADAFKENPDYVGQFDLILEHTFYCAVSPERRNDLVKIWKKYLAEGGHLLGIFFAWPRTTAGPPFAGSEWEIRRRLENDFRLLYWTRWKNSVPNRQGMELVVYASKKDKS